ncbi:hypothetical protein V1285_006286 [Bradyrhizobium sp. AZCC 1620]
MPSAHGHRRLGRIDHGNPQRLLQRKAVTRHAGTAHHDGAGSVFILERAPDLDHLCERSFARCRLRHAHVERPLPGQAIHQAHLPEITNMAANRALRDRNDPEGFCARERRQHAAFGDAEHGPVGGFAADMQARIAVAGNDEGSRMVVAFDEAAQRHRHTIDVGLALDPVGAFGQRFADDLRSAFKVERLQGLLQPLCYELVGIGIDDENARPGHGIFLRDNASVDTARPMCNMTTLEAMTMPSSNAWSTVCCESARECNGTICAFVRSIQDLGFRTQ